MNLVNVFLIPLLLNALEESFILQLYFELNQEDFSG